MDLKDFYLDKKRLIFIVIDMQEALVDAMKAGVVREVIKNIQLLIQVAKTFQIPIIFTEQYPKGLRKTVPPIREILGSLEPVEKVTFSCLKEEVFTEKISDDSLNQAVIMGMETHVCVFQTVLDLLSRGYTVHVPRDATCSRVKQNWVAGLSLMEQAGALITSAETIAFQLLEKAGTDAFRALAPLLK
jgi:nicotinamidase-related amidase